MSEGYIYCDINEFVSHLIQFIDIYIDSSWIPQTDYRQLPRGMIITAKKYVNFRDKQCSYSNTNELIDICLSLKRSKYLYLNSDRTRGIVIHTTDSV
jgi:hypothetical protein